ncbi:MAG: hypothetical protein MRY49_01015 [Candidatus Pacebacteria bacterium]|nr:hypothetical protein [Candidatus Paceibacterota bacterium]
MNIITHRELGTDDFLHRFFSPYRVPDGLTESEKRTCVKIYVELMSKRKILVFAHKQNVYDKLLVELQDDYVLLEKYREGFCKVIGEAAFQMTPEDVAGLISSIDSVTYQPINLPAELLQSPMSRESFLLGIRILKGALANHSH